MRADPTPGVRSVAIVGRGHAAWLAAIALHRAYSREGVQVTVIETPGQEPVQAFHAALPDLATLHRPLGIAEADLLREADAAFSSAQAFVGWSGGDAGFLYGYGDTGEPIRDLPFVQFWARAHRDDLAARYDDFNLAAAAARHGRLPPAGARRRLACGFHLDAAGYLALLRRRAAKLGIARIADRAPVATVRGGAIAALRLAEGGEVTADLYIDATGPDARLIEAVDPDGGVAAAVLPCDRLIRAMAPALDPQPLYSRTTAHEAGWIGLFPLERRTAIAMCYRQEQLSDDRAAGMIGRLTGLRVAPDMIVDAIPDRIRSKPWVGNCVAIGAAAAQGDPLDAVELHRTQVAVAHLVKLLPVARDAMVEADIYNDEVVAHYLRLRDFQLAHYCLNARDGEPFWDAVRAAPVPEALETKISLFQARGMIAQHNQESFNPDSWQSLLVGHGVIPRSSDPRAAGVPEGEVAQRMQAILHAIAGELAGFVSHRQLRDEVLRR